MSGGKVERGVVERDRRGNYSVLGGERRKVVMYLSFWVRTKTMQIPSPFPLVPSGDIESFSLCYNILSYIMSKGR